MTGQGSGRETGPRGPGGSQIRSDHTQVRAGSQSIPSWPRSNQDRPITGLSPNLVLPIAPQEHFPKTQARSPSLPPTSLSSPAPTGHRTLATGSLPPGDITS